MADISILRFESRRGEKPFHPYVEVELTGYTKDCEGRILLTPDLVTPKEIDFWCDRLIDQIKLVRDKAKKHVTMAKGSFLSTSHRKITLPG